MWWSPTARTSCRGAAGLSRAPALRAPGQVRLTQVQVTQVPVTQVPVTQIQVHPLHESLTDIHPPAGRDHVADGGRRSGGLGGIPAIAGLGAARGGLSYHSGRDVLSRRRSRGDGLVGDVPTGAAVWPGARSEPDDVNQFDWQFGDHASVWPRSEH